MRRRNIKNAHERLVAAEGLFILNPEEHKGSWHDVFNNDNPIDLEIGMGKGKFIIEMAKRNPNINYLGMEKFESVIIQAITKLDGINLPNLHLVCCDAEKLEEYFDEKEIRKIYLNFSDPWPKTRHEKRRLTSANFLNHYKHISSGEIEFKTDNKGLFEYSVVSLNNNGYHFNELSFDLHSVKEDIVTTEYEDKFSSMGNPIYFINATLGD